MVRGGASAPVVFYAGAIDPDRGIPPGAFGLTNRPDELYHLVMDVVGSSASDRVTGEVARGRR
jgi:hypothetical protein